MWQEFATGQLSSWLIYVGGAATLVAACLSLDESQNRRILMSLTAAGGLFALIGGGLSDWGSSRAAAQLNAKNDKIISLQEKSLNHFTGGDSIVYLHFFEELGEPKVQYKIEGDESVPNVVFQATDVSLLNKLRREGVPSKEIDSRTIFPWEVSKVRVGTPLGPGSLPFRDEQDQLFIFGIVQPNGRFVETVRMHTLENTHRVFAYRVFQDTGVQGRKRILRMLPNLSFTDDDFPPESLYKIEHPEELLPEWIAIEPAR